MVLKRCEDDLTRQVMGTKPFVDQDFFSKCSSKTPQIQDVILSLLEDVSEPNK